jgi:hypothetical protein
MKRKLLIMCIATISASPAYAASEPGDVGLLAWLFLGIGALVIVFQLIPGLILYGSMLKGLFSGNTKGASVVVGEKTKKV